jgi:hypothetical protein
MPNSLSDYEVGERAASAEALLSDPVVGEAMENLREAYLNTLLDSEVGTPEAASAHAGMKVLEDFKAALLAMVTEKKMRAKYGSKPSE